MCGRFANAQTIPQYRSALRTQLPNSDRQQPTLAPDADDYRPTHNVAPQTRCPVVRREQFKERAARLQNANETDEDQEQVVIQTMKWGLIPRYNKTPPSYGEAYKTINARDDTILSPQRSMWHPLLPSQRCVIFVQGFYEWQKRSLGGSADSEKVERIPHFVGMKEDGPGREDRHGKSKRLMALAGLYESVVFEGEKEPLYTFTIVTTSSNDQLEFLHDRMPVILPTADAIGTWLGLGREGTKANPDDTWTMEVAKLLRPASSELDCYKVPREVGKVGNSDPSFILPIEERKDGLRAFFAKQQSSDSVDPDDESPSNASHRSVHSEQKGDVDLDVALDDDAAMQAAERVEEDIEMTEATERAEREHDDHQLALLLHRELNGEDDERRQSNVEPATDEVEGHDVGDGFAVPDEQSDKLPSTQDELQPIPHNTPAKSSPKPRSLSPSSRFSPDPYNPPLSPDRPRGGYSRTLPRTSGGGIHTNPVRGRNSRSKPSATFPQAAPHTWKNTIPPPSGSATKPINQIFAHTDEPLSTPARPHTSPPPPSFNHRNAHAEPSTPKRARVKSVDKSLSPSKHAPDIRSFFSPKKT